MPDIEGTYRLDVANDATAGQGIQWVPPASISTFENNHAYTYTLQNASVGSTPITFTLSIAVAGKSVRQVLTYSFAPLDDAPFAQSVIYNARHMPASGTPFALVVHSYLDENGNSVSDGFTATGYTPRALVSPKDLLNGEGTGGLLRATTDAVKFTHDGVEYTLDDATDVAPGTGFYFAHAGQAQSRLNALDSISENSEITITSLEHLRQMNTWPHGVPTVTDTVYQELFPHSIQVQLPGLNAPYLLLNIDDEATADNEIYWRPSEIVSRFVNGGVYVYILQNTATASGEHATLTVHIDVNDPVTGISFNGRTHHAVAAGTSLSAIGLPTRVTITSSMGESPAYSIEGWQEIDRATGLPVGQGASTVGGSEAFRAYIPIIRNSINGDSYDFTALWASHPQDFVHVYALDYTTASASRRLATWATADDGITTLIDDLAADFLAMYRRYQSTETYNPALETLAAFPQQFDVTFAYLPAYHPPFSMNTQLNGAPRWLLAGGTPNPLALGRHAFALQGFAMNQGGAGITHQVILRNGKEVLLFVDAEMVQTLKARSGMTLARATEPAFSAGVTIQDIYGEPYQDTLTFTWQAIEGASYTAGTRFDASERQTYSFIAIPNVDPDEMTYDDSLLPVLHIEMLEETLDLAPNHLVTLFSFDGNTLAISGINGEADDYAVTTEEVAVGSVQSIQLAGFSGTPCKIEVKSGHHNIMLGGLALSDISALAALGAEGASLGAEAQAWTARYDGLPIISVADGASADITFSVGGDLMSSGAQSPIVNNGEMHMKSEGGGWVEINGGGVPAVMSSGTVTVDGGSFMLRSTGASAVEGGDLNVVDGARVIAWALPWLYCVSANLTVGGGGTVYMSVQMTPESLPTGNTGGGQVIDVDPAAITSVIIRKEELVSQESADLLQRLIEDFYREEPSRIGVTIGDDQRNKPLFVELHFEENETRRIFEELAADDWTRPVRSSTTIIDDTWFDLGTKRDFLEGENFLFATLRVIGRVFGIVGSNLGMSIQRTGNRIKNVFTGIFGLRSGTMPEVEVELPEGMRQESGLWVYTETGHWVYGQITASGDVQFADGRTTIDGIPYYFEENVLLEDLLLDEDKIYYQRGVPSRPQAYMEQENETLKPITASNWSADQCGLQTGWHGLNDAWYYFDPADYAALTSGVHEIDGVLYLFDEVGRLIGEEGAYILDDKEYRVGEKDANGRPCLLRSQWYDEEGIRVYYGEDGAATTQETPTEATAEEAPTADTDGIYGWFGDSSGYDYYSIYTNEMVYSVR